MPTCEQLDVWYGIGPDGHEGHQEKPCTHAATHRWPQDQRATICDACAAQIVASKDFEPKEHPIRVQEPS